MNFWLGAALLCALAMAFVLAPWWLGGLRRGPRSRSDAAVAVVRARLEELAGELRDGTLDAESYEQLKLEQERRLLQDVDAAEAPLPARRGRGVLAAAALLVPLGAAALYYHYGGWSDWNIQRLLDRSEREVRAGQDNSDTLRALTAALEQRLELRNDDDGRRRFMLARIDTEFGRYVEAKAQYRRLQQQFPDDPDIAAQYAQALYLSSDRKLTDEVAAQARRALAGNPDQITALGLLGIGAFEQHDYAQALLYWRHLQRLLPAGSANAAVIEHGIQRAEQALGPAGFPGPKIAVSVSLSPQLAAKAPAGATLFVFARAVGGPPMPLAVARFEAAQLPLQVTLDDSMAMAQGMNLSSFKQVQVVARLTTTGQVRATPGDLEGSSQPLTLDDGTRQLSLQIDRRL